MADNITGTELGIIQIESTRLKNIDNFLKDDENITRVECPFPNVTSAVSAFQNCSNLESFKGDLNSLTDGTNMFSTCVKLDTFTGKLPNLTHGNSMFYHTNLSEFTEDLPSLQNGNYMFYHTNLSEFTEDLPSLKWGDSMFEDCKSLKTFNSYLRVLENYYKMFKGDKLNSFNAKTINITDTGSSFMTNSGLSDSKTTLTSFYCMFPNMTNTDNMFADFTSLIDVQGDFSNVTSANNMFYNCISLKTCHANFSSLISANSMFQYYVNLESFKGDLNSLTNGTQMFSGCEKLNTFTGKLPNLTHGNSMFYHTNLSEFTEDLPSLQDGTEMFRECKNLSNVSFKSTNLQIGKHMFRDCPKLNENNLYIDVNSNIKFYDTLVNGIAMFQGTSFTKIPENWQFNYLEIAKQMFQYTQIGANGETVYINMPNQFPKVKVYKEGDSYKYGEYAGPTPVSYMFSGCPIKSINFDVSSLDNGISMFHNCTQLTQCTGAKFQEGGSYQSMFTESNFTEESVITIFEEAIAASVQSLHIGMNGLPSDSLKNRYGLVQLVYGKNSQWCRGELPYCVCHQIPSFICDTVQAEIAEGNTSNLVEGDKDKSVVIVCNNISEGS